MAFSEANLKPFVRVRRATIEASQVVASEE
jgi:hypothetical protein